VLHRYSCNEHDMATLDKVCRKRDILRWILAIVYSAVGIIHLRSPNAFMPIMPNWVPHPHAIILFTGACEVVGAVALLTRRLRYLAGIMFATYAVCVFPANIKHALDHVTLAGTQLSWWYHAPRLAFQPVFVWWALFAGGVVDWPFRKS